MSRPRCARTPHHLSSSSPLLHKCRAIRVKGRRKVMEIDEAKRRGLIAAMALVFNGLHRMEVR